MRKKPIFENVLIEGIAAEGKAIARVDNKVIFVPGVAPGDVVDIRVTRKKKSFYEGTAIKFHTYSKDRVEPFCDYFGTCGGCKWQHIPYNLQLAFKNQQVTDNLVRIGKIDLPSFNPILASSDQTFYRNKLEFTFSDMRWLTREEIDEKQELERNGLGFHIPGRFDKIVDIDKCHLQAEPSNSIRNWVKAYALANKLSFFNLITQEGYLRILIIRTTSTGQNMVILQVAKDKPEWLTPLLDALIKEFPKLSSVNYVINNKRNETFNDLPVHNYYGTPYIEEAMTIEEARLPATGKAEAGSRNGQGKPEKLTFRIGPKSFYQTNSLQAYELYKIARSFAGLTGNELVYDLYTGTGTIANFVAHRAKKVIGLEYVEDAIEDAKINSSINSITNTAFYAGDIKDLLNDEFISTHGKPNVIITDPPRAGMHQDVINMLLKVEASKIVYVSCNPATQARDLALLDEKYKVTKLQPVDMFPQTHHVENIALLELR
ncbi:MAG: class I SAM-dependent RNA methyltransferase [Cyclobacteriaceae bacterium]|nr:class I SAM-dependent RNA methyltransferase [Cyclobacteriaceae bacterium]